MTYKLWQKQFLTVFELFMTSNRRQKLFWTVFELCLNCWWHIIYRSFNYFWTVLNWWWNIIYCWNCFELLITWQKLFLNLFKTCWTFFKLFLTALNTFQQLMTYYILQKQFWTFSELLIYNIWQKQFLTVFELLMSWQKLFLNLDKLFKTVF